MSPTPAALLESAKGISDLADKLGLIATVKQKLLKNPDAAAAKLSSVLDEIMKSFLAFETEVVEFLAIALEPGAELRGDRATLYELEGQALWARIQASRGHCSKIANLYTNHLNPWFQRVLDLDRSERDGLQALFLDLSNGDGTMVDILNKATWWLGEVSEKVLTHYEVGEIQEANDLVVAARREILPVRRALAHAMAQLQQLESDFVDLSGVS
jgi:hypothetical protein